MPDLIDLFIIGAVVHFCVLGLHLVRYMEREQPMTDNIVDDGFGNRWQKCQLGAECSLQIVRPGKVQCDSYQIDGEFGMEWAEPCVWEEARRG